MLTPEQKTVAAGTTRLMQIIIFALTAGVCSYLAVALTTRQAQPKDDAMPLIGAGFAGGALLVSTILGLVPPVSRQSLAAMDGTIVDDARVVQRLLAGWQVQRIIRAALLEGAAFMNITFYCQGGLDYTLWVVGTLLAALIALFPLRPLVEEWLDRELRTIRELRDLQR